MATGVVALAADFVIHAHLLARCLTGLNAAMFVALWGINAARCLRWPREVLRDLKDFDRGPGFFTVVAGTAVLGVQMAAIPGWPAAAFGLWAIAVPLWACLLYAILFAFTVAERKPRFEKGINGGWLISIVATQGIADLGARVSAQVPAWRSEILFLALALWLAGGMLYVWLIALIFLRFTFYPFRPQDFIPPFRRWRGPRSSSRHAQADFW